jgi:hypothetical protein
MDSEPRACAHEPRKLLVAASWHRRLRASLRTVDSPSRPGCCCWMQMAARLELRTNYVRHRQRIGTSKSGRFSLEQPKSFPLRNSEALFAGTCYEKPVTSFDAQDPTRAPPPRIVRERPGWDESVVVTHGLDRRRPRSAAPGANNRHRQHATRTTRGAQRDRPSSAERSAFGMSSIAQHTGWDAQESTTYESPPIGEQLHTKPAAMSSPSSNWSVDLKPEQARAFVEFVTLLTDVERSGNMSMVHLAQAAVDQATAQRRRSADNGGLHPA